MTPHHEPMSSNRITSRPVASSVSRSKMTRQVVTARTSPQPRQNTTKLVGSRVGAKTSASMARSTPSTRSCSTRSPFRQPSICAGISASVPVVSSRFLKWLMQLLDGFLCTLRLEFALAECSNGTSAHPLRSPVVAPQCGACAGYRPTYPVVSGSWEAMSTAMVQSYLVQHHHAPSCRFRSGCSDQHCCAPDVFNLAPFCVPR